jgi:hypothetical protein
MNPNYALHSLHNDELEDYLSEDGYLLRRNSSDKLELFEFGGGYRTTIPYWEQSTGNIFSDVESAFKWAYTL